jgi:hypothetical protein
VLGVAPHRINESPHKMEMDRRRARTGEEQVLGLCSIRCEAEKWQCKMI